MAVARGLPTTRIRTKPGYPRVSSESWLPRTPDERDPKRVAIVPTPLRVAVAVIMLQAAALTVIAAIVLIKTVVGHPDNVGPRSRSTHCWHSSALPCLPHAPAGCCTCVRLRARR